MAARGPATGLSARWERAWAGMASRGYDALVVAGRGALHQYGALEYIAGYCPWLRLGYAVIGAQRPPVLVLPTAADAGAARSLCGGAEIRDLEREPGSSLAGVVTEALGGLVAAGGRVGVVGLTAIVPVGDLASLRRELPQVEFEDATLLISELKAVKDEAEFAELARSAAVVDTGLRACAEALRPGVTPWRLAADVEHRLRLAGARELLVLAGTGPFFGTRPSGTPLCSGDLVTVYVEAAGPTGYWVEEARLFALGVPDERRRRLAEACRAALDDAEALLRAGAEASAVAGAVRRRAAASNLQCSEVVGHGVGLDDQDEPTIAVRVEASLRAGMALALHPQVRDPATGLGASLGTTYRLGAERPARLSTFPLDVCH